MTNPNAYLRLMFRQWQMTRRIPGTKKRLVVNLGTGDIVEARKKRDQVWSEFLKSQKTDEQIATELAAELVGANPDKVENIENAVLSIADDWEAKHGLQEAKRLARIALGRQTPVVAYLETFLSERPCAPNTKAARTGAIKALPFNFVQDVNVVNAGHYVTELARTRGAGTVNGIVSHLRVYWEFLKSKGIASSNPWNGHVVKRDRRTKVGSGVWSFSEVAKMLTEAKPELQVILRTLVYSGCRVGELAELRAEDLTVDGFEVKASKTKAGERRVYLPNSLVRQLGKQTGFVFLPQLRAGGSRGRPGALAGILSEELRRLFPEHRGSRRNSDKTCHGLRKLWATVAEQEGIPLHLVQAAGGWAREGVMLQVYSSGPSSSQVREVFAKVAQRLDSELMST